LVITIEGASNFMRLRSKRRYSFPSIYIPLSHGNTRAIPKSLCSLSRFIVI